MAQAIGQITRGREGIRQLSGTGVQAHHVSLALTSISLVLLLVGTFQSKLDISSVSLAASYHPIWYAGLLVLLAASVTSWLGHGRMGWLTALHFAILVFALYFSPVLLEGVPRPRWSPAYFGWTQYILDHGELNRGLVYHNWPGLFLFSTAAMHLTGITDSTTVLMLVHFIMPAILIAPAYVLCRSLSLPIGAFSAFLWVLTTANWMDTTNYQPQAMAMLLLLLLFALVFQEWRKNSDVLGWKWQVLALIVFSALVTTHFATGLVATAGVGLLWLVRRWTRTGPSLLFVVTAITIFGAWALYGSTRIFEYSALDHLRVLFRIDLFFKTNLLGRVGDRGVQDWVIYSKLLFWGMTVLLAGAGLLLSFGKSHRDRFDGVLFTIATAPLVLVAFPVYLGEDLTRVHLFMLIPFAYFAAKLLRAKIGISLLSAFLFVAIPLHMITHYGSESYDRLTPEELYSHETFYSVATSGYVVGGFPLGHSARMEAFQWISWPDIVMRDGVAGGTLGPLDPSRQQYVALSLGDQLINEVYSQDPEFFARTRTALESSRRYRHIYTNPSIDIFQLVSRS